jgi:hypothetical protein
LLTGPNPVPLALIQAHCSSRDRIAGCTKQLFFCDFSVEP